MEDLETQRWYCFTTQPKREHIAATNIRVRAGLEALCPRISYRKKTKRGVVRFVEPLFPNYIFVYCNIHTHLRHIMAMQGVKHVIKYGERIPHLPSGFVEEIANQFPEDMKELEDPEIVPGQEVILADGPFQDLKAIVETYTPTSNRIRVLLEFLGRDISVEVDTKDIVLPDYEPKKSL
jgi:transcriptional antiterminator RfaH